MVTNTSRLNYFTHRAGCNEIVLAITKTRNGESGKGIGEWGMGNGKTRNTKRGNL